MEVVVIFIVLLVLMSMKIPVAFSMAVAAVVGILVAGVSPLLVPQRMFFAVNSFLLIAIPLFIFVGNLMNIGGITDKIFSFARVFLRHRRGSLGHVNVVASIIFAGMSGSAVADASGLGLVEIREMNKDGYEPAFSAAITAAASTIGPIIPPSIPFVVYAVIANVSIGRLFLGGIIPGLLMGIALMIYVYYISKKRGYPKGERSLWKERAVTTFRALPALFTPLLMLSGIVFGVVTPTEGAALATVYSMILGFFIYKELTFKKLYKILVDTASGSAQVLLIIASASVISWILVSSGVPAALAQLIFTVTQSEVIILIAINVILLILGCFMDASSLIIIMVPVLLPIVNALGINPVQFGVVLVLNVMIGLITPPVGMCLYIVSKISGASFEKVCKEIFPMLGVLIVVLFLITFIPPLVTFIPDLLMGAA